MFNKAGCELNDLACMRALTTEEVSDASKTGAMGNDNVAMVLNGSFGPTHRSDLMPETLFDAVKNVSVAFFNPSCLKIEINLKLSEMFAQILLLCGPLMRILNWTV